MNRRLVWAVGMVLFAAACLMNIQVLAQETPVTIGLMAALSGDFTTIGNDCRDGYEAARLRYAPGDKIPRHRLRFVYADSKGLANVSVAEFQKLSTVEQALAVVGHRSQALMPLNPLSQRAGIPLLGIAGQSELVQNNPYAFRFWPTAGAEAQTLISAALTMKLNRAALITVEDEYALSLAENFKRVWLANHGSIVLEKTVPPSLQDFLSLHSLIKNSQADLIFSNVGLTQHGVFVKQARELGLRQQIFGNIWMISKDFIASAGRAASEGVVFSALDANKAKYRMALSAYRDEVLPSAVNYACFSALRALLQALEGVPAPADRSSLYQALRSLPTVQLPDEEVPMQDREARFSPALKVFRQGQIIDWRFTAL